MTDTPTPNANEGSRQAQSLQDQRPPSQQEAREDDWETAPKEVLDALVNRFLCWRVPDDFAPDSGISFDPGPTQHLPHCWPTGTCLLTAAQAKTMFEHCLQDDVTRLLLCEASKLHLRPGRLYYFHVDENCEACRKAAAVYDAEPADAHPPQAHTLAGALVANPVGVAEGEAVAWGGRSSGENWARDGYNAGPWNYRQQPGNGTAWAIGEACRKAANATAGDYIDRGLVLLRELQVKGYGIIALDDHPAPPCTCATLRGRLAGLQRFRFTDYGQPIPDERGIWIDVAELRAILSELEGSKS